VSHFINFIPVSVLSKILAANQLLVVSVAISVMKVTLCSQVFTVSRPQIKERLCNVMA